MKTVILSKPFNGAHKTTMPRAFVKELGMQPGDKMSVELKGNSVVFTPITEG
ncbi:MAG: hypothetical protein A4E23_01691 [Methanomethylovorans sp. PtaU1.Bin073]|nr:MAG: hypothetical protein A4E23_01691 [Methanomethylovorans sp. PtaU1.Bin073]